MTRRISESGFTLLEVLVASLLLAMLITILTMVFNSSSIAWSTGKAGVVAMDAVRNDMAAAAMAADDAVPRVDVGDPSSWGTLVSPWDAQNGLRQRAVVKADSVWEKINPGISATKGDVGKGKWVRDSGQRLWAEFSPGSIDNTGKAKAFIVGVWSIGPDGTENTDDDISTWPDID